MLFTHLKVVYPFSQARRTPNRTVQIAIGPGSEWPEGIQMTASDVLIEKLIDWGVEVIFGLPGDGINGVFEALHEGDSRRTISPIDPNTAPMPGKIKAEQAWSVGVRSA